MDPTLDLAGATVVAPPDLHGPECQAVTMLVDEVEARARVRWPVSWSGRPEAMQQRGTASPRAAPRRRCA